MRTSVIIAIIVFEVIIFISRKLLDMPTKMTKKGVVAYLTALAIICFGVNSCSVRIEERKHIKSLYSQAIDSQDNQKYIKAEEYLEELLSCDSDNKKAKELLKEIKPLAKEERISDLMSEIKILRDEGEFVGAYNRVLEILDIDSSNEEAEMLRQELVEPAEQQKAEREAAEAQAEAERQAAEEAERLKREAEAKAEEERKAAEEQEIAKKAEAERQAAEAQAKAEQAEAERKAVEAAQKQAQTQQQTIAQNKEKYINSCISVTSYDLLRNPASYQGKHVFVGGTVTSQVQLRKGTLQSVLESAGISSSSDYELITIEDEIGEIAILYSPSSIGQRLLEGDYIRIFGDFTGLSEITETNFYGTSSTYKVPQVKTYYCE